MDARVKAYAKLNLTLSVTGRENGYHLLDSVVCTVDLFDLIKLKKRKDKLVFVEMHGFGTECLPPEKNNAVKAAEAYVSAFGTCGADIVIYKNIPIGAGLGGSSADISGVLIGMNKLYGACGEERLKQLADGLGSDTGYMLTGGFARLTGRGDIVEHADNKTRLNFLLLVPSGGVSTAECFRLYDSFPQVCENTSAAALKALSDNNAEALAETFCNGLYSPAVKLNPGIAAAAEELKSFSPLGVNMTGSGSGVYALFDSAELCAWAKSRYRGKSLCIQLKTHIPG